jgi:hypothetical protein
MQIVVLGTHRSGTSLVTRVINMMGAFFDSGHASIGFSDENPKGFWERSDVIAVNDRLLAEKHCAWDRLAAWKPSEGKKSRKTSGEMENIERDLKNILLTLNANRPWVVKDPRLCLTFPHWRAHLEAPVVVCVHRAPLEVAMSLKTRYGFSFAHGLALWEYYTVSLLNALQGLPVIFVEHQQLLADAVGTVKRLHEALEKEGVKGLRLPSEREVTSFIEPSLHRSKLDTKDEEQSLSAYQRMLGDMLAGRAPLPSQPLEPSLTAKEAMQAYEHRLQLDAQLTQMNEKCAQAEQEANELRDYRRTLAAEVQQEMVRVRRLIEEKDAKIRELKASKSWKLGNALVRFVTLRWISRAEAT